MSIRKWYTDIEVLSEEVVITVDVTGIDIKKLWIGVSNTFNSLVLRYNGNTRDIPINVKVIDDFSYVINNGVLTVRIKRLL